MQDKLFFVHSYISYGDRDVEYEKDNEIVKNRIILLRDSIEDVFDIEMKEVPVEGQDYWPMEGEFVFCDGEHIENANAHPIAFMYNTLGQSLRDYAENLHGVSRNENKNTIDVRSFHINVGHGNCSIIIFRECENYTAWMVDCSIKDYMNNRNYTDNLKVCLDNLEQNYHIQKLSKLLITHQHYDHINGIHYLLNKGWIDSDTEVWLNTNYPWSQPAYLNILSRLIAAKVKFVNPVISNSTQNIKVIYPKISFNAKNPAPGRNINNASVVYQIVFNGISMVFPGDMEREGWNEVICSPYLNNATYYCVSHHGSLNGHLRDKCYCGKNIKSIKDCIIETRKQILMGRHNAYPGIFHPTVLRDLGNLEKTDQVGLHYLELDWKSGKMTNV